MPRNYNEQPVTEAERRTTANTGYDWVGDATSAVSSFVTSGNPDPHAKAPKAGGAVVGSQAPTSTYHTPGMPVYTTAPAGTPSRLPTGGSLGNMMRSTGGAVASATSSGVDFLANSGNPDPHKKAAPSAAPKATSTGGWMPRLPQRTGNILQESNGGKAAINSTPRTMNWGGWGGGWGGWARRAAATSPAATNPGGWARSGGGPRAQVAKASAVSPSTQAAVDRSLGQGRSAADTTADPHNWAGIARDLGNAGSAGFARYKTGGYASSAAKSYVAKSNLATAPFEGPPGASSTPVKPKPAKAPLIGRGPR